VHSLFVVPANAGIHTPRPLGERALELIAFAKRTVVVMGPAFAGTTTQSRLCGV
jgi:hypothetical protein